MEGVELKNIVILVLIIIVSYGISYGIDQYYVFGKGYTFFFDILKL